MGSNVAPASQQIRIQNADGTVSIGNTSGIRTSANIQPTTAVEAQQQQQICIVRMDSSGQQQQQIVTAAAPQQQQQQIRVLNPDGSVSNLGGNIRIMSSSQVGQQQGEI